MLLQELKALKAQFVVVQQDKIDTELQLLTDKKQLLHELQRFKVGGVVGWWRRCNSDELVPLRGTLTLSGLL